MKTLGQQILEMTLSESLVKTILVVYPGRFQPMGQHHAAVYKKLASKFGKAKASLQFWAIGFVMMDFPIMLQMT